MWLVIAIGHKQGFENVVELADTNERMKWEDCVLVQGKWSPKRVAPCVGYLSPSWLGTTQGSTIVESHGRFDNTGKSWQVWQHRLRVQQLLESMVKRSRFKHSRCFWVCLSVWTMHSFCDHWAAVFKLESPLQQQMSGHAVWRTGKCPVTICPFGNAPLFLLSFCHVVAIIISV